VFSARLKLFVLKSVSARYWRSPNVNHLAHS